MDTLKKTLFMIWLGTMFLLAILPSVHSQPEKDSTELRRVQPVLRPKLLRAPVSRPQIVLKPDLVVAAIDVLVHNPGDAQFAIGRPIFTHSEVRIRPIFKNIGTAAADLTNVSWSLSGGPIVHDPHNSGTHGGILGETLAPNATTMELLLYFGPGQVNPGTYNINVMVDPVNQVAELSEANNTASTALVVMPSNVYTGRADLRFAGITATEDTSSQCGPKRTYNVDATVVNAGTFPAYIHGNGVIRSGKNLTTSHNEGYDITLLPSQTKTIRFSTAVDYGATLDAVFTTDAWQQVMESDETNNTYTFSITAPPRPASSIGDLVVADAYFEYTPTNNLYWLVVTLLNNGPRTMTICESSWSTKNAPQGLGWTANAPQYPVQLASGQTYQTSTSARDSLPQGTFSLTIEANPNRTLPETNYTNNRYTFSIKIPEDVRTRQ